MTSQPPPLPHWNDRPEPTWKDFHFNQPYQKGLTRLKREVLEKTNFDPATLWQWGTMQALAVIEILKDCEKSFGAEAQKIIGNAMRKVGLDVGRQVLKDIEKPTEMSISEFVSFYLTVLNRIAYASLEAPKIDSEDQVSFDIIWCPHQDHYQAFDCRVQRYFVQGMLEALEEFSASKGFEVRFDTTIPSGAPTCHFTVWNLNAKRPEDQKSAWLHYTTQIEAKALKKCQNP